MQKIWNFRESEAVETDGIDTKAFKSSGKFYDDTEGLCKLYNIKLHPSFKAPTPTQDGHEEVKELSTVTFNKHRVDKNTMKVLFLTIPASPTI